MTDAQPESSNGGQPAPEPAAPAAEAPVLPAAPVVADERPELVVGAAFAGGLALAFLLKRLGR